MLVNISGRFIWIHTRMNADNDDIIDKVYIWISTVNVHSEFWHLLATKKLINGSYEFFDSMYYSQTWANYHLQIATTILRSH